MSRLPPVPYEDWDTDALAAGAPGMAEIPPSNALGLLAHHPALARMFLPYSNHLLLESTLPGRDRELAILRVAWRKRCLYEWVQHVRIARRAGVTEEEIDAVRAGADTLINRAVDELDAGEALSDEAYARLAEDYDERQLLEFVFTVGTYGTLALAFNTFGVEPDAHVAERYPELTAENFNSMG